MSRLSSAVVALTVGVALCALTVTADVGNRSGGVASVVRAAWAIVPACEMLETPGHVTQAENSKDSYFVLKASLALSVLAGIALFWYFDVFAGLDPSLARKPV